MTYSDECTAALTRQGAGKPSFLRIPTNWFLLLMADENTESPEGGIFDPVPAHFWKFLFVLWRELMWARKEKGNQISAALSLRDFGMRPNDACLWANAVVAGGLFRVTLGTFSSRKRSTYYLINHGESEAIVWQGFYRGLMMAHSEWRVTRTIMREKKWGEKMEAWRGLVRAAVKRETEAFRVEV